ncbi:MAG: FISUMP domain-containing protein [Candidatus Falkowbacteria bacterium]
MKKSLKAFTLIELLVVIAIIGILATISVLALSNARAKSRDAKRAGDMKQVQTALELFFNDNNRYPTIEEWNTGKIYSTTTDATSTYMQIIPTAPTPADGNCGDKNTVSYTPTEDLGSYSISFCLGNTTGTLTPGPKCLTPGGIVDVDCAPIVCNNNTEFCGFTTCGTSGTYGNESYPTVSIGSQCWMAKNLNIGTVTSLFSSQENNGVLEKYCSDDDINNCLSYGGLYQWDEAMQYSVSEGVQGICPIGWHIPTDSDQNTLDQTLNDTTCNYARSWVWGCANAGTKLQSGGTSNFEALLAGRRDLDGSLDYRTTNAYFWSSTVSGLNAFCRILINSSSGVNRYGYSRNYGNSVRCLQN